MEKFEKEVKFLSLEFNGETNKWDEKEVTLVATFKDLDRRDKEQHKLHFKLVSLFNISAEDGEAEISSDRLYDITSQFVKLMLIPTDQFTATNKNELLQDSGALFELGMWLMKEKLGPFFLNLTGTKKE